MAADGESDAEARTRDEVERAIRALGEEGDYDLAATRAIDAYGREILSFLKARLRSDADAWDVFSTFSEDLWRGIPGFAWRCTLRAWAYTLARHAEVRFVTAAGRRPERNLALADLPDPAGASIFTAGADAGGGHGGARTGTAPYQRTDVKNRFRALRARLGEEDQLILVLRVDRGLSWGEIAQVLADAGPGATETAAATADGALEREEARIRKRFQIIKERLRSWAGAAGLLDCRT